MRRFPALARDPGITHLCTNTGRRGGGAFSKGTIPAGSAGKLPALTSHSRQFPDFLGENESGLVPGKKRLPNKGGNKRGRSGRIPPGSDPGGEEVEKRQQKISKHPGASPAPSASGKLPHLLKRSLGIPALARTFIPRLFPAGWEQFPAHRATGAFPVLLPENPQPLGGGFPKFGEREIPEGWSGLSS